MKELTNSTSNRIFRIILISAASLMPLLITSLLAALAGHRITEFIPYYVGGDAIARYDYVRNIIEHGHILGYNGYDYVTAKIPSLGSAWGLFWAIPYVLFGKVFGWSLNSPIIANIVFLCLANLIFILLTECSNRTIALIMALSCLLYINIDYSISAMSEPSRYSAAIILAAMIYRLAEKETSAIFRYILVPLFIIYASSTFILMSAYIIPYCLIVFKNMRRPLKYSVSLALFGAGAIGIKRLNSMFCTPYFQGFNMKKDIAALHEGIIPGISTIVSTSLHNLRRFSIDALSSIHYQSGRYTWFVGVCWIMMLLLALLLILRKYPSGRDKFIIQLALYLMVIITSGYIVLYNDDYTTLVRGINTALCAAVFLTSLMDSRTAVTVYMVLALMWSPFFVRNFINVCNDEYRTLTAEQTQDLEARQAIAAENIILEYGPDSDPWDNTVAIRYGSRNTAFIVPSGAGKISMHRVTLNETARYVLIGKSKGEDSKACIAEHLDNGHVLLAETDDFAILRRED